MPGGGDVGDEVGDLPVRAAGTSSDAPAHPGMGGAVLIEDDLSKAHDRCPEPSLCPRSSLAAIAAAPPDLSGAVNANSPNPSGLTSRPSGSNIGGAWRKSSPPAEAGACRSRPASARYGSDPLRPLPRWWTTEAPAIGARRNLSCSADCVEGVIWRDLRLLEVINSASRGGRTNLRRC